MGEIPDYSWVIGSLCKPHSTKIFEHRTGHDVGKKQTEDGYEALNKLDGHHHKVRARKKWGGGSRHDDIEPVGVRPVRMPESGLK